jgi:DNA-binding response OmpR family regulator/anti-sigma regulatory factor (Ser/Thr protein kinase)
MTSILVIEDDLPILDNVKDTLEAEGFRVMAVPDGVTGVKIAKQQLPDLIVCDILMAGLDGFGVLQQLREDPQTATIPLIFLTARVDRESMRRGMNLGADDYITKPFTSVELLTAVRSRLKKQTATLQQQQTTMNLLRKSILYALPHQLRSPLVKLIGYGSILEEEYNTVSRDELHSMASAIMLGGQELHRIFENYLVYAQIELISSDPEQIAALRNHSVDNPGDIIQEQAIKKAKAYQREADLRLHISNAPVNLSLADLTKIAAELIDNAFKFSPSGSQVRVRVGSEDSTFALYVRDYGRGMTVEQLKSIGAYMQFERAVYEQQGLGLGLIIAKRLVELYGGQFLIYSIPDQGTVVGAKFPVRSSTAAVKPDEPNTGVKLGSTASVV